MSAQDTLDTLRLFAKKLARARRIKLHGALDVVARILEHPHWPALTTAHAKGWIATPEHMAAVEAALTSENPDRISGKPEDAWAAFHTVDGVTPGTTKPLPRNELEIVVDDVLYGELDGHPFRLMVVFDDVTMEGRGWRIEVPEAPSAKPRAGITDRRIKANPIQDESFRVRAVRVAQIRAAQVRAKIASDWPRRSLVPDDQGIIQHPLFRSLSRRWACGHCEGVFDSAPVAANLWHCPSCNASPIDMNPAE